MPKISLVVVSLLLVSSMLSVKASAKLLKICENKISGRQSQFETNKQIVATAVKALKNKKSIASFRDTDLYGWARMVDSNTLGEVLAPADRDDCVNFYQSFINEKVEIKAQEKLSLWRSCLRSDYRDDIPPMGIELLKCHGASVVFTAEKKLSPEELE